MRSKGVDTILEVSVQSVRLNMLHRNPFEDPTDQIADTEGGGSINPSVAFSMTAHVRLIDVGDGTVHLGRSYSYPESARPDTEWTMTEWTMNDAHFFREALDSGCQILSDQIAESLFSYTVRRPYLRRCIVLMDTTVK